MSARRFIQCDVFSPLPLQGNGLAVVVDAQGVTDEQMQRFAAWTNLSETTFLLPPTQPQADYRVRIFTPGGELPFAGHPTLGSCHAWLQGGGQARDPGFVVQQCQQGLVRIRRDGARLNFAAPALTRCAPQPQLLESVTAALGLNPELIVAAELLDNGPTVLQLEPDHLALRRLGQKVGVAALEQNTAGLIRRSNREARAFATQADTATDLRVRAFAAPVGVNEDPVTGSLNASLAQWLIADGHLPDSYLASQGERLGRNGLVHVKRDAGGQVWVGGDSVTCVDGSVLL